MKALLVLISFLHFFFSMSNADAQAQAWDRDPIDMLKYAIPRGQLIYRTQDVRDFLCTLKDDQPLAMAFVEEISKTLREYGVNDIRAEVKKDIINFTFRTKQEYITYAIWLIPQLASVQDVKKYDLQGQPIVGYPRIKFIWPKGGENIHYGDTVKIEWESQNVDMVTFGYSSSPGSLNWFNSSSSYNVFNHGYFMWVVKEVGQISPARIRLDLTGYHTGIGSETTVSEYFTIKPKE